MEAQPAKLLDETARVVVLGDPGVGKTSLIIAATESFDPSPPACLPPTRLPPNFEGIPLLAIDTSDRSENRQSIEAQIEGVDVILLCYSVDMPDSIRHIRTYWLPELRRHNSTIPIVVCGCRMDLAPDEMAFESQRKFLEELLKEYREVETAIECSARCMQYVQEVFHFALKAVCHPQFPLYDTINQRLKPRCSQALKRIFFLCDRDKDNLLDEEELNDFQVKVFWAPLQPEELEGVLSTVARKLPSGVQNNSFTVNGFLYLHAMLMEQGRYETTWTVLRKFGYTNDLTLSNDLLDCVPFDHAPDQVLQLSETAVEFLTEWFLSLDETNSKTVHEGKIQNKLEETSAERMYVESNLLIASAPVGHVTLSGFLSRWHYAMLVDPRSCLKQLLYMGWSSESVFSLFSLSKHRKQERREQTSRSVILCWVFGSDSSGRKDFLKAFVGPSSEPDNGGEVVEEYVAAGRVGLGQSEKTLVLKEVSAERAAALAGKDTEGSIFDEVDVAVFLYSNNSRQSFDEAKTLMLKVSEAAGDYLPCLLVCNKSDQPAATGMKKAVETVCQELRLRPAVRVSTKKGEMSEVFKTIVEVAIKPPHDSIPETPARKARRMRKLWSRRLMIAGGVATATALVVIYVYPRWSIQSLKEIKSQ